MQLRDSYDGAGEPFEGDRTIIWRSLPENAVITKATVTLEPRMPPGQRSFVETLTLGVPSGAYGATVIAQSTAVELDFHARRRGISYSGIAKASRVAVDIGGGVYLAVGADGQIPAGNGPPFEVGAGVLPGIIATRLRFVGETTGEPSIENDARIVVATQPSNLALRFGNLPAFWSRPGDLAFAVSTPDIVGALTRALEKAHVVNGYYEIPLLLHSDTLGRVALTVEVDYLLSASLMPDGLSEVALSYDYASLPKPPAQAPKPNVPGPSTPSAASTTSTASADTQAGATRVLHAALPPGARIVSPDTLVQLRGAFSASRVVQGPIGPIAAPPPPLECSRTQTLAQPIVTATSVNLSGVDVFVVPGTGAAQLALDVRGDLNGKPSQTSLLARPLPFPVAPDAAAEGAWVNVPIAAGAQLQAGKRFWLVMQALDDARCKIGLAPSPAAAPSADPMQLLQRSADSGFSWRLAGPSMIMLFRLRTVLDRFTMPLSFLARAGDVMQSVSLAAYDPLGKVEAIIDRSEIAAALQSCIDEAAPHACWPAEQLRNGDFDQWTATGDVLGEVSRVILGHVSGDWISFVDTFSGKPFGSLDVGVEGGPRALAFAADGVVYGAGRAVGIVDPATLAMSTLHIEPPLDSDIVSLAADPAGRVFHVLCGDKLIDVAWSGTPQAGASAAMPVSAAGVVAAWRALVVSGSGARGFIADVGETPGILSIDFVTGITRRLANFDATSLALAGDRTLFAVDAARKRLATFDADTGVPGWSVGVLGDAAPRAVAAAGNAGRAGGTVAYVLGITPSGIQMIHAVDARGRIRHSVSLARAGLDIDSSAVMTVTPQGDRIYVATGPLAIAPAGDRLVVRSGAQLAAVAVGMRQPAAWTVTVGHTEPRVPETEVLLRDGAMSQVVAIKSDCPHELGVSASVPPGAMLAARGTADPGGDGIAELLWLSADGALLRRDVMTLPASTRFVTQRLRVQPPAASAQVEMRVGVTNGVAVFRSISLRTVASLVQDGAWATDGEASASEMDLSGGTVFRNPGVATQTFSQNIAWTGTEEGLLTVQGTARGADADHAPAVQLHFCHADGTDVASPLVIAVDANSMALRLARIAVPSGTATIAMQILMPPGAQFDARRIELIPLRSVDASCAFVAQAPGELHILAARVVYDVAPPAAPAPPPGGLAKPTPPGRAPGQRCGCGDSRVLENPSLVRALLPAPARRAGVDAARPRRAPIALTAVSGIGAARAKRLTAAGIASADALAAASPETVLDALSGSIGVTLELANTLVSNAKNATEANT
ncbi:helix-hairpin-helix domain-containing protein [Caballeronia novacaledonica]|uniref:Helix-hairpin-helix domain-containing protein n=1 Tax=Caballeronia novacaledonica TaxID=1544861 RepID=A0AA37MJ52_9BURK|nr:helix-hairpin-helix domain-containing protein [Caballeronia novacaledonica]GJH28933.1 hypothetical protein CBA19CS42_30475 [Caballeronia novacaledonica]